jgi:plasmid stabilization system protein ParE
MLQIVNSERALKEFEDAYLWYEENQIGLGERFSQEYLSKINFIKLHPNSFPKKKNGLREILVDDFPYSIIYDYKSSKELIVVASIFHNKRNPKKKFKY